MLFKVLSGALIPLLGTTLGAFAAFVSFEKFNDKVTSILSGFASGVMVAASVWSLLLPAIEYSTLGRLSFVEPCIGLVSGLYMMLLSERISEKFTDNSCKGKMLYFAVTLHNIPEGMAIGAAYSAYICIGDEALAVSALLLSVGIAIQNIPEGAIVSLPYDKDENKIRKFFLGTASGVVEPIAVLLTVFMSHILVPVLPFMLSFAAGAMFFVVIKELIPDFSDENKFRSGIFSFYIGFIIMMSLDVALG